MGTAATLWLGATILRLDREQRAYEEMAALEEGVRLALWRMDSALGPFIAAESMRPYNLYSAFYTARDAVDPLSNDFATRSVLLPSPLLTFKSPYIRLHFQLDATGRYTSPQVPDDTQRPLAQANYLAPGDLVDSIDRLVDLKQLVRYGDLLPRLSRPGAGLPVAVSAAPDQQAANAVQLSNNRSELFSRMDQALVQQQAPALKVVPKDLRNTAAGETPTGNGDIEMVASRQDPGVPDSPLPDAPAGQGGFGGGGGGFGIGGIGGGGFGDSGFAAPGAGAVPNTGVGADWQEEPITPLWVGKELMLVRPVRSGGAVILQGCWLDWPAVEAWLLGLCKDLLPDAGLVAVTSNMSDDPELPGRQLASLPVRLVPGARPAGAPAYESPMRIYLLAAVGGIALATLAIAALLWGAVSLSERRGRFVSAVTHELRTPLTTFRLYTEMLAGGMVPGEEKRQQYFETLHTESSRLSHLVENVLAYARLERGPLDDRLAVLAVSEVLARVTPRLEQRALHSGMAVVVEDGSGDAVVRVDPGIVEQILYNLVDNACKYAAAAEDRRIHVCAENRKGCVHLRVCDHGPGVGPREGRRIFRPFTKSVHEAARSAPGVGLGLGLSRRLAQSMGGALRLEQGGEGACFLLRLPRHDRA